MLIGLSVAAIITSLLAILVGAEMQSLVFGAAFLFGLTTFPIYSVATAHGSDFARTDQMVELSAAFMFLFALGAIASPVVASALIEAYGPKALFLFIALAHVVLTVVSLLRMASRPTVVDKTEYSYVPRTTFGIGAFLRRNRISETKDPD